MIEEGFKSVGKATTQLVNIQIMTPAPTPERKSYFITLSQTVKEEVKARHKEAKTRCKEAELKRKRGELKDVKVQGEIDALKRSKRDGADLEGGVVKNDKRVK